MGLMLIKTMLPTCFVQRKVLQVKIAFEINVKLTFYTLEFKRGNFICKMYLLC